MGLVYQCDRCKTTVAPEHGDQREPGPFPPNEWDHVRRRRGAPASLCPTCSADLAEWLITPPPATPAERDPAWDEPF